MRRLVCWYLGAQFLLQVLCLMAFCQEADLYYVIPAGKLSKDRKYSKEELTKIFREYAATYEGKPIWGLPKAKDRNGELLGVVSPAGIVGSAEEDLAASCYRCGLGRSDLVKEKDCRIHNHKWNVSGLKELKTTCN